MGRLKGSKNVKSKMIKVFCLRCKKEKLIYPYRKNSFKYCSYSCRAKSRIATKTTRKKLSDNMKNSWKKGLLKSKPAWNKGKENLYLKGSKNPNWNNGSSFKAYGKEFNKKLKRKIRSRDNFTCRLCGKIEKELKQKLDVHHIDYNKKNNALKNLISLCRNCHMKTNFKREDWTNYLNKNL